MFTALRNCHTAQTTINPIAGFKAMPLWSQISNSVVLGKDLDRSYEGSNKEQMLWGATSE